MLSPLLSAVFSVGASYLAGCTDTKPSEPAHAPLLDANPPNAVPQLEASAPSSVALLDAATPSDATTDTLQADTAREQEPEAHERDAAPQNGPTGTRASVTGGAIEGVVQGDSRIFLGIPYAAPPVGDLRFAPPLSVAPWQGTLATKEYGASCLQPLESAEGLMSEDCLTLNVFAPAHVTRPLPVMVFFYGGAFISGTSRYMDGRFLAAAGDVIVVTMNFRLGALGFFVHPALEQESGDTSGNMGIRDQQLGLRWVHDNISAFGGDPDNVTLFGQSSGAVSVCLHMVSPASKGLARRFVLESGGCNTPMRTRESMISASNNEIGRQCPLASDAVACLRALPESAFVASDRVTGAFTGAWFTYLDGSLIPDEPDRLFRAGQYHHGPVLLGSNSHEFGYFARFIPTPTDPISYGLMTTLFYPHDSASVVAHYLPTLDTNAGDAWLRQQGDSMFRCPTRALARVLADQGEQVFLYNFDVAPGVHALELDYVFGWPNGGVSKEFPNEAPNPPLQNVVAAMQSYFSRFATRGDPNGPGTPNWPTFTSATDRHMILADSLRAESGLGKADCDFWDHYFGWPVQP